MTSWTRRSALLAGAALSLATTGMARIPERDMTQIGPYKKKLVKVNGHYMAYAEGGEGDPIVFLHGNPTSSYLWRKIMPYAEPYGRVIAPDLIGMGDSDKLPDSGPGKYSFVEHREYLNGLFDKVGIEDNVTLVIHDWGSALGFDWAYRNPDRVKAIVYMESLIIPPERREQVEERSDFFKFFFTEEGERATLQDNAFVERFLIGSVGYNMTDADKDEYRRPFANPGEDRRPTLTWPQQVPFGGEPPATWEVVTRYSDWMPTTEFPKLLISSDPGAIMRGEILDFVRSWQNQTEARVKGGHFIQEESPTQIGWALASWLEDQSR